MKPLLKSIFFRSVAKACPVFFFCFFSCATVGLDSDDALERRNFVVHKVQYPIESPALISDWYTGDQHNWVKFFVLKKNKSEGPYLPIGSEVFIPVALLHQKTALPEDYAVTWRNKYGVPKNSKNKTGKHFSKPKKEPSSIDVSVSPVLEDESNSEDQNGNQMIENLLGSEF